MVAGPPGVSGQPVQGHVEAESGALGETVITQCKFLHGSQDLLLQN